MASLFTPDTIANEVLWGTTWAVVCIAIIIELNKPKPPGGPT